MSGKKRNARSPGGYERSSPSARHKTEQHPTPASLTHPYVSFLLTLLPPAVGCCALGSPCRKKYAWKYALVLLRVLLAEPGGWINRFLHTIVFFTAENNKINNTRGHFFKSRPKNIIGILHVYRFSCTRLYTRQIYTVPPVVPRHVPCNFNTCKQDNMMHVMCHRRRICTHVPTGRCPGYSAILICT